jgi:hypothetical protein
MFTQTCLRKAVIPFANPLLGVAGKPLMSTAWLCLCQLQYQLHALSELTGYHGVLRMHSQINTVVCARDHLQDAADGLWTHGCVAACMGRRLCRVLYAWIVILQQRVWHFQCCSCYMLGL